MTVERIEYGAVAPEGRKAFVPLMTYVSQCGLDPILIDLVYLRVSQINGCAYCIDKHSRDLLKRGVSLEKILMVPVWHEADALFTAREQAALRWSESVTGVSQTHVPDAAYTAVTAEFNGKELADLTIVISLMNAMNRMAISFRMMPEAVKKQAAMAASQPEPLAQ